MNAAIGRNSVIASSPKIARRDCKPESGMFAGSPPTIDAAAILGGKFDDQHQTSRGVEALNKHAFGDKQIRFHSFIHSSNFETFSQIFLTL
jgi:hypothetical protein